jgi:hypothetical protein
MSVRTRIALGTLCMFNAVTLLALGVIALRFVDGAAAPAVAVVLWIAAASLFVTARRLRHATDW